MNVKRFGLVGEYDVAITEMEDGAYILFTDYTAVLAALEIEHQKLRALVRNVALDAAVAEVQEMRAEGEGDLRCAISRIRSLKTTIGAPPVNITVNAKHIQTQEARLTWGDIVAFAGMPLRNTALTVTCLYPQKLGMAGCTMRPGESVETVDGMIFNVADTSAA